MTHEEFKSHWTKKHRKIFADMNRVLKTHGIKGSITGLDMTPEASVRATMPAEAPEAADDCCDGCKAPPCNSDEVLTLCSCPDGSGGVRIRRCCVKA